MTWSSTAVDTTTLVQIARRRAEETPDRQAYAFLLDGEVEGGRLSYAELDRAAKALAATLQHAGLAGERALLLLPPGLDFVASFLGCLYAGVTAVPAYPPRPNRSITRVLSILDDCSPRVVVTSSKLLAPVEHRLAESWAGSARDPSQLVWLAADEVLSDLSPAESWVEPTLDGSTLAFLQYTSGSTSLPKGVMVRHSNLLHNQRLIAEACEHSADSVFVSWLPLYHDLGLIGNLLQALYVGAPCVLMTPANFLQRPRRWLEAITRYGATTSGAPNFAYELCCAKIPRDERQGLDLSSWRVAFNGAEPVRAQTLERFAAAFRDHGFDPRAAYPCYGLAEATLIVSAGRPDTPAVTRAYRADALEEHRAEPVDGSPDLRSETGKRLESHPLVSSGCPLGDQQLWIVDPATGLPCGDRRVGEIWLAGDSVAAGYWGRTEESRAAFGARLQSSGDGESLPARTTGTTFLRTGDLGFLDHGELFITGRLKDLIIVRGRNLYPHDVERTAETSHPALRPGCGAAFSVDRDGVEHLVVVHEIDRRADRATAEEAAQRIRRAVAEEHEVQPSEVVLIRVGTLLKTSSGKVQRRAIRQQFLEGSLRVIGRLADEAPDELPDEAVWSLPELLAAPPARRREWILAGLTVRLARRIGVAASRIDPTLPLASLGLDSLGAIELQGDLEDELGLSALGGPLSAAELLEDQTVEGLGEEIRARLAKGPGARSRPGAEEVETPDSISPARSSASSQGEVVLSQGQRALWFLERLTPEHGLYNIVALARSPRPIDAKALERALAGLVERHATLRLTITARDGEPRPSLLPPGTEPASDFASRDGLDETAVETWLLDEAHHPFDLARGPLLRLRLARTREGETFMALALHHLAADFHALAILARELGALYGEAVGGPPAELDTPTDPFAFARWQRRMLASATGEALWDHWRRQLDPLPEPLELPTDRPRPIRPSHRSAAVAWQLDGETSRALIALGRRRGATAFATLQSAFVALLHRLSGQDDLVVGTPTAGRERPGWKNLVNYLVDPVALRVSTTDRPGFATLTERVRRRALAALAHRDLPFALLVERLAPTRDGGRHPLFQVMFSLQQTRLDTALSGGSARPAAGSADNSLASFALARPGARIHLGRLTLDSVDFERRRIPFDLVLSVAEEDDAWGGVFEFATDLFDRITLERWSRHLSQLIDSALAEPERPITELAVFSPAEQAQLLHSWSETSAQIPPGTLGERIAEMGRSRGDALAVLGPGGPLDYAGLIARAEAFGRALLRRGLGRGDLLGVMVEPTAELPARLLGITLAGAGYVPLDPSYPADRLAFVAADAGLEALLCDGGSSGAARALVEGLETSLPILRVDRTEDWGELADTTDDFPELDPEDRVYVLYTSGSTGRPKGVEISHRALLNFLSSMAHRPGIGADDHLLAVTSLSFDIAGLELFGPLLVGGRVEIVSRAVAADGARLAAALHEGGANVLQATPSTWRLLVDAGWQGSPELRALCGGEALPADLASDLVDRVGELWNLYGPTETTVWSLVEPIAPADAAAGTITLGRPIARTSLRLLGPEGVTVPLGAAGEILLGGAGLARGYLRRPALTAERFVPDPWGDGDRLYRTGDLARLRSDDRLSFLGRLDHQVKLRGFRIELGEIEAALGRHPMVAEAVVTVWQPPGRGADEARLVAHVVPRGDASGDSPSVDTEALRRDLGRQLPDYMVPAHVVELDRLPLTPNRKIDRRALPAPELAGTGRGRAPRGRTEETLAMLWRELLGVEGVAADDDFFRLGGHSLLATRLAARIGRTFGIELEVAALFETPTLARLATLVEGIRRGEAEPIPTTPPGAVARPSLAQERLAFLDRLSPGQAVYHLPLALRLRSPEAPRLTALTSELARALGCLVARHEALRMAFPEDEDGLRLAVAEPGEVSVALAGLDLATLPPARHPAETRRAVRALLRPAFALARPPLWRVLLIHHGGGEALVLLALHHLIVDGTSMALLIDDLASALGASDPAGVTLPTDASSSGLRYRDYAAWQRSRGEAGAYESGLVHWQQRLDGLEPLALPTDRPRPTLSRHHGALVTTSWPAPRLAALEALVQDRGASLFMGLVAGFSALLGRLCDQRDVALGSPFADRPRSELEGMVGLFVNTVVLRTTLDKGATFTQLLESGRATVLDALRHQQTPFELVVERLRPERRLAHNPLFQVLLAEQTAGQARRLDSPRLGPVELRPEAVDAGVSRFDLALYYARRPEGLGLWLEFDTDLFDPATADAWLEALGALVEGAVAAPDTPVDRLPLLGPTARQQLLASERPTPPGAAVHRRILAQAERTPEALALVAGDDRLSYGEVAHRVVLLAADLRAAGAGPESIVGVALGRTPAMVCSLLAVLEAGAAYLALDPAYPPARLDFMLDDTDARIVVIDPRATPELDRRLAERGVRRLDPSVEPAEPARPRFAAPHEPSPVVPDRPAWIIYTSGSTGRPKGVVIRHGAAAALLDWADATFDDADLAGVLLATSMAFDISVFELFAPLTRGGAVILAENALALPTLPARDRVTLLDTVPSVFAELLHAGELPAGLRVVALAGEALPRDLVDAAYRAPGVRRVMNLYGPSEDTTFSTAETVPRNETTAPAIGRALPGTRALVVDRGLEPRPLGVPGELCLAGAGLARGYHARPAATAERFVPDPTTIEPGGRLYRTGDRVRRRADGRLEFLGRLDHQVKIRGFRVELGEVETVLREQPGIDQAVVAARNGRLVAFVVPASEGRLEGEQLAMALAERLPHFMVPAHFATVDALPRLPNGKVDRSALPEVGEGAPAPATGSGERWVAPRNAREQALAELWSEVLGVERVGAHDDFFALGGHSLLVSRLLLALRRSFGVELPLRSVFETPTLAGLAERLAGAPDPAGGAAERRQAIPPAPRDQPLPLSVAQRRLWFLHQLHPDSPAYNLFGGVEIAGPLDRDALTHALAGIVERHEALRTTFEVEGGRPVQRIAPASPPRLEESGNGRAATAGSQDAEPTLDRALRTSSLRDFALAPFDLEMGPLLRLRLVPLAPEDGVEHHLLAVSMHHIVADGWSLDLLFDELGEGYAAARGNAAAPAAPPIQVADVAVFEAEQMASGRLEPQIDFWRRQLADSPTALDLPLDRPRPATQGWRGARRSLRLCDPTATATRQLARHAGVTLFMTLLAGFEALLARLSGQNDVLVGTPVAHRDRPELEGLIGFFANTLVLRAAIDPGLGFSHLLETVRNTCLDAYAHQDVPFEKLVEALAPRRDTSRSPFFQHLFVFQNAPHHPRSSGELALEPVDLGIGLAKFDLTLTIEDRPDGLLAHLDYDADLFDATTAQRWLGVWQRLLDSALAEPERALATLDLLSTAERHQMLAEWNDTADTRADDDPRTPHQGVVEQARRTPETVAVELETERLTYRQLVDEAHQLAHHLATLGVGCESRVGLSMERHPRLLVALLGTLAAGAAYVPLDPGYPRKRLDFMLDDARLDALITHGLETTVEHGLPRVDLLHDRRRLEGLPTSAPGVGVDPEHLAYVLYTSGSTGRPKGAMNSHGAIVNRLLWMQTAYPLGPDDRVLQKTPMSFDVSGWELFWPLMVGARLVMARPGAHVDSAYLARTVAERRVTTLHFVPSMLRLFVEEPAVTGHGGLRRVIASGEALPRELCERFHQRLPGVELHNLYGPTEAAIDVTAHPCRPGATGPVPIGRPIRNLRLHVLDTVGRPVPVGVPGELMIGGVGLARGYHRRPGLTAERFVPDPFTRRGGDRLYRTGDLARYLADGAIEFLGRLDHQVKLRGQRIELGEIEAALAELETVREAVVLTRELAGRTQLVAYVVGREARRDLAPGREKVEPLRHALAERLPEVMVPGVWVFLDTLPTTANGKLDRRALPEPTLAGSRDWVAPASANERRVAEIWGEVLGRSRVGARDNFFDLGGHSLALVEVAQKLHARLGVELPVLELFQAPTVAGLAQRLDALDGDDRPGTLAPASTADAVDAARRRAESQRAARGRSRRRRRGDD